MWQREKLVNQVISVNRRKYAVGLLWQPVGAGFVARGYARNLARSVDRNLNLYAQYRSMVALGANRAGHRTGMPSAAAEVLETASEYTSFLAVFKAGDKFFYLVAVRNGVVLEDALFDNARDARARYAKLSEIPDWSAFIAPGEWGMPRAIERNLSDMITGGAHATLRPIGRARTAMISVVLIALFGAAMFTLFRQPIAQMMAPRPQIAQIDPELAAEYKRRIEETNRALDEQFEIEKSVPEPLVLPYEALPVPAARAELCYRAIGFLMQPVVGWNQVSARCDEDYVRVQMRRSFGTLVDFYEVAGGLMPGALVEEKSESRLDVSARLPKLETFASQDERDPDSVVRDVTSAFQAIDTDVETNIVFDTLSNGTQSAVVSVVEVGAQSKLTPVEFIKIFDNFGGVYMTACEWDALRRIWNYEVIIYAK